MNPFAQLEEGDVGGQYDALRQSIFDLHGLRLAPSPKSRGDFRAQLPASVGTPGADLSGAIDLLCDVAAGGHLDTLLSTKGTVEGGPHPYVFALTDLSTIDPEVDGISLMHTRDEENYFGVEARDFGSETARMMVYGRPSRKSSRLTPDVNVSHPSLRSWLFKFLVPTDQGNSLIFGNYLLNKDIDAFRRESAALFGPPGTLGPDTALYWSDNVVILVHGQGQPWVDLWVHDRGQDWARNDIWLATLELSERAIANW